MGYDINQALVDLQNSPQSYTDPIPSNLQTFILEAIDNSFNKHTKFSTIKDIDDKLNQITALDRDLRIRKEHIHQTEIQYKKAIDKMDGRFHFLTNKMDKFETQLQGKFDMLTSQTKQFIDSKKDVVMNSMDESIRLLNTKIGVATSDIETITTTIENHSMNIEQLGNDMIPMARFLKHVTTQMKELYKLYQRKTTILDSTLDTLHEEIDNVRINAENVFWAKTSEIITKLRHDIATQYVPPPSTPFPSTPTHHNVHNVQPSPYPSRATPSRELHSSYHRSSNSNYKGVKTDVLWKMVKLSCNDSDQLLDFYTKLRTAMLQAGIYLREIQDISEDKPIYEEKDGYFDSNYRTQGNALYYLCNEDVIPQEFIFAQNCLKSMSATMDGFQMLKSMLVLVHPTLNNHRPPNNPPVFSKTGDLHLYEQSLWNYFLLHKIYGRSEFTKLDKSKQFIEGLDCNKYEHEKTRLMAILDSVELNSLELTSKHTIQSLATSTMNMAQTKTNNVQINTFQGRTNTTTKRSTGLFPRRQYRNFGDPRQPTEIFSYRSIYGATRTQKFSPKSAAKQKFTKGQCNACKIYGHHVRDCRFIAPHLVIQVFMKNQPEMCKQILDNHISINTVEHKHTIIRTM